jgi:ubiquitin-conjugating enzyme E2 O
LYSSNKRLATLFIVRTNLTYADTIYVRAFEDRMDLFRAAMVGARGTPYHDGLFFFDLQLPPSYPAAPPMVNYRSFGLRLNPNLYESGTVCLSLLDTFGGEGTELWSPASSTVLQVLVSIQGLVLTAQPFYNEIGYESLAGQPEGRRNELPYSENTYLLNLQTMLHLLRRPPAGFEVFVKNHFCRRGRRILRACEAYMDGCTVGSLDDEACPTELSKERPSSAGFRLALANVVPRLLQAFKEIGADDLCE